MASYYPEGECFFLRSSLRYPGVGGWTAENQQQFYSHVLVEYYWNGWVDINQGAEARRHIRSAIRTGRAQGGYRTVFGDWHRFYVGESRTRNNDRMLRISAYENSLNWNECRDLDRGGPRKYIIRPIPIRSKDMEWLWIDATIPIRAIYFPVSQRTDEAFPQFCTYVVIDFRARRDIQLVDRFGTWRSYRLTPEGGLGRRDNVTWGFKVPDIIAYLTVPHKLRNPEQGLFRAAKAGDELVVGFITASWRTDSTSHMHFPNGFHRQMDLANIISATFAVEVGWRPYQYSNFILNLVLHVVNLGLGFIPGVGPLLSVAFGMGVQLLQNPDSFRAENVLDLSAAVLETLINSSRGKGKFIAPDFLPHGSYKPIPWSSLSEEEREEKKKVGEEIHQRITKSLKEKFEGTETEGAGAEGERVDGEGADGAEADGVGAPRVGTEDAEAQGAEQIFTLQRFSDVRDPEEVTQVHENEPGQEDGGQGDAQVVSVQVSSGQEVAEAVIRFK